MARLMFIVPGNPKGKGRPRFTKQGRTYTPKETAEYERLIGRCYRDAGGETIDGGVTMEIVIRMPIPTGTTKKMRLACENGEVPHLKRPDVDNIIKAVLDGLNGLAYHDDNQVYGIYVRKIYGLLPGLTVTIDTDAQGAF